MEREFQELNQGDHTQYHQSGNYDKSAQRVIPLLLSSLSINSDKNKDPGIERQHEDRAGSNCLGDLGGFVQESTQSAGEEAEFFKFSCLDILQDAPSVKGTTS